MSQKDKKNLDQVSENQFEILFNESPDALFVIRAGVFVACNRAAEKMLGANRDRIIGTTPASYSPERQPDGRLSVEVEKEKGAEVFRNGTAVFEWVHRRSDGTSFPVEVILSLTRYQGEDAIFTVWRDISWRRHTEETLSIFRESLENATDAIGMSTPEGRHYYQNRAFNELFGKISENPQKVYVDPKQGEEVFKLSWPEAPGQAKHSCMTATGRSETFWCGLTRTPMLLGV